MTGLVAGPVETDIAAPSAPGGVLRLRFVQTGPATVEVHDLTGPGERWVATAHHFDHPSGPLLRTNYAYRALLGVRDGDRCGAEVREQIRDQARAVLLPCLAQFGSGGEHAVYLMRERPRRYRLCTDTSVGPEPICDFGPGGTQQVWHANWQSDPRINGAVEAAWAVVFAQRH